MISDNMVVGDNVYLNELRNFFFAVLGMMSLTHYGAVGDGRADNYTALQVAIDDANRRHLKYIYVPYGLYRFRGELLHRENITFIGNPEARIYNDSTGVEIPVLQFGIGGGGGATSLTDTLVLVNGTAPTLDTGVYFTGPYSVMLNGETVIPSGTPFYYDEEAMMFTWANGNARYEDPVWVITSASADGESYSSIEFLGSKKGQIINTNILSQVETKVQMKIHTPTSIGINESQALFGSTFLAPNFEFGYESDANEDMTWYLKANAVTKYSVTNVDLDTDYEIEAYMGATEQYLKVGDTKVITDDEAISGISGSDLFLFATNAPSIDANQDYADIKMYYAKIFVNNELVRDYLPSVRNSDKEVGMYDMVCNRFFENKGIGGFMRGDISPTPAPPTPAPTPEPTPEPTPAPIPPTPTPAYTQLTNIISDGGQYIDTGVKAQPGIKLVMRFMLMSLEPDSQVFFGNDKHYPYFNFGYARNPQQSNEQKVYIGDYSHGAKHKVWGLGPQVITQDYYTCEYEVGSSRTNLVINDGNPYSNITFARSISGTSSDNLYLFGYNSNSSYNKGIMSLSWAKIYLNGTLVRDLVPAMRNADGEICLYDAVSGQYFTNKGTGVFTYGMVMPIELDPGDDDPDPEEDPIEI